MPSSPSSRPTSSTAQSWVLRSHRTAPGAVPDEQERAPLLIDRFCDHHDLPTPDFPETLLRRSLYLHARLLRPILKVVAPRFFALDQEFIYALSLLRSRRDYPHEANHFFDRSRRNRRWRHRLRLRVSAEKVRKEIERIW